MVNLESKEITAIKKMGKKRKLSKDKQDTKIKVPKLENVKTPKSADLNEKTDESTPIGELKTNNRITPEEMANKYPLLNDTDLVKKFQSVPITNNQKGRIRQQLRGGLIGTSNQLLPDVIYNKMKQVTESKKDFTEAELRKMRILYNMLITAVQSGIELKTKKKKSKSKKDKAVKVISETIKLDNSNDNGTTESVSDDVSNVKEKLGKDDVEKKVKAGRGTQQEQKVRGPKRYVVFIGNLPPDTTEDKIMQHFSDLKDQIIDVRIPKQEDGKKSCISFVELKDEPSYELALSKHHSMLDNKRINVLYTTQKNTKITASEAKSTSAKLQALQKSGKLLGSVPLNKKRSFRRKKAKMARDKLEKENQ